VSQKSIQRGIRCKPYAPSLRRWTSPSRVAPGGNFVRPSSGRYEYPVVPYQDAYCPFLPIQALRLHFGLAPEKAQIHFGEGIQLGSIFMPTDEATQLLINYYGPARTFPPYSFIDMLHNRLPETTFRDCIVLIGVAAAGLGDTFVTLFSMVLPGVERHAAVMANILRGDALQRRDTTGFLELGAIAVLGLAIGWLSSALHWSWGMLMTLVLGQGIQSSTY
jgi:adenylate cyclase